MLGKTTHRMITAVLLVVLSISGWYGWASSYSIRDYRDTSPGEWKFYYLQSSEYSSLSVEYDWVSGQDPNASATALLEERIEITCDKPGGVNTALSGLVPQSRTGFTYNLSEIENIEDTCRNIKPDPWSGKMAIYILYLNGWYRGEDDHPMKKVLGVSYRASSIAVFRDAVWTGSSGPLSWKREAAVLIHEYGHLMGLVNIGYRSQLNHEHVTISGTTGNYTREYDKHCNDTNCVMYPEIEYLQLNPIIVQNQTTNFCVNCTKDISALRTIVDTKVIARYTFLGLAIGSAICAIIYVVRTVMKKRPKTDESIQSAELSKDESMDNQSPP